VESFKAGKAGLIGNPQSGASLTKAIFVMEIALEDRIPTYSGGLGVLAGDLAYSFADIGLPATFVTLLSRNGYTSQKLDADSGQLDSPQSWDWSHLLQRTEAIVEIDLWDKPQKIGAWEHKIPGKTDTSVLFLDTDFPENSRLFRSGR
jgi:starch phosphorylase